ncbi:MAG: xanthine dehydrogenase small subunit, partial [Betaproteobacteria bacterium]|nr:xanthine dehydrogenase small subunit [Betaproteobacteria bacterium]
PALLALRTALPQARLLAGSTDVGLWVTKQHRDLGSVIYLGRVAELQRVALSEGWLELGASVSLSDAMPVLLQHYPGLQELLQRFASTPIRNAATLGGNIANGSPIGDSMPALIAIGARVVLRSARAARELPLEDFYLDYQKTALQPDEVLECVRIPLPPSDGGLRQLVASYKVSRRFDQDISAVCAGFSLVLEQGRIRSARIAFGGMAATPRRAAGCEAALQGLHWHRDSSLDDACAALAADYTPLTDLRATAQYRQLVAGNLLRRFLLETTVTSAAAGAVANAADGAQPVLSLYRWNEVSA